MTAAEYKRLYRAARATYPNLTLQAMKELKRVYLDAAKNVAEIVRRTEAGNLSELTSGAWRQIQHQLEKEAEIIREAVRARAQYVVERSAQTLTGIEKEYLFDIIDMSNGKIVESGIINMYVSIDRKLVSSMVNRIYQDGYTFSDRIWKIGEGFSRDIKDVITTGLSAGRDAIDIAKDLEVYVRDGRKKLATRYGKLEKGTASWMRRIRKDIDYSALRLVRSEMYQSLQDASVLAGETNPGCTQEYDWVRNGSEDWGCECPSLAAGSPYASDDIPEFPHPNCLCTIRPRLRDANEFYADVKKWANGGDVDYMDEWYKIKYNA
jgi:hypothetical protein